MYLCGLSLIYNDIILILDFLIIGDNRGYGNGHPSGRALRGNARNVGLIDLTYVHFLGRIPYQQLITVLRFKSTCLPKLPFYSWLEFA